MALALHKETAEFTRMFPFLKMMVMVNLLRSISLLNQAFFLSLHHLRVFPNAICSKKGRSLLLLHYKIFCMQDGMAICFSSILSLSYFFFAQSTERIPCHIILCHSYFDFTQELCIILVGAQLPVGGTTIRKPYGI